MSDILESEIWSIKCYYFPSVSFSEFETKKPWNSNFFLKLTVLYNSTDRDVLWTKSGELNYKNTFDINICSLWV